MQSRYPFTLETFTKYCVNIWTKIPSFVSNSIKASSEIYARSSRSGRFQDYDLPLPDLHLFQSLIAFV